MTRTATSSLRPSPLTRTELPPKSTLCAVSKPVRPDLIARDRVDYMDVPHVDGVCRSRVHPLPELMMTRTARFRREHAASAVPLLTTQLRWSVPHIRCAARDSGEMVIATNPGVTEASAT